VLLPRQTGDNLNPFVTLIGGAILEAAVEPAQRPR
jgi:hypothetical protein